MSDTLAREFDEPYTNEDELLDVKTTDDARTNSSLYSWPFLINNPDLFEDKLIGFIEDRVHKVMAHQSLNQSNQDNPFSSVYLCDLKPDESIQESICTIKKISSRIIDRSEEIEFNDGLD